MVKTTKEMVEVMQAFERGEKIEVSWNGSDPNGWNLIAETPSWDWSSRDYRVAPKPKKQIKLYCYFGNDSLSWVTHDRLDDFPKFIRVPAEDKIIEVDE